MLVRNAWLFVVPVVAGPVTARAQAELTRVSFWEAHGWKIAVVVAVLVLQTVLIALLLANRRHLRLARMDLHESAEHMRLAARAAKTASWMLDLKTNRVWTTPEGRALLGWGETEPIDLDRFIATLPPEERERARRGVASALTDGGEFAADYRVVLADGSERWISMRGRAEFDNNRRPVCVRGVSMDVTAQRQAVAEANDLRRQLTHSGRVSLMGQLLASVSHELGQPLGAILRNADAAELFLKSDRPDLEEIRAIVSDIRRDDERATAVIARMRALLRRHAVDMQDHDLAPLVAEVRTIIGADADSRRIIIVSNVARSLPPVRGDRVHLQQVLINLVMNAMDAVDASPGSPRRVMIAAHDGADHMVEISVRDTGAGIPSDQLTGLFSPFFTTKSGGMGMGLPISKTIVEAHGGRIWAENHRDGGAVFHFTIPAGGNGSA